MFNAKAASDFLMKKVLAADTVSKISAIEIDYTNQLDQLEKADPALYEKVSNAIDARRTALNK